ncbi:MAG: SNF2-related protein [Rhabdochlamydiaceae bacterium]
MLNFRKLKQDFPSAVLKEGKDLFDNAKVVSAKLLHVDNKVIRLTGKVKGQYDNCYESEIEIDRQECEAVDSDCDCPYNYDCQHLAALVFYLENNIDKILVAYSKENDLDSIAESNDREKEKKGELLEKIKAAESKVFQKQEELYQKQLLQEYTVASQLLSYSPFFRKEEKNTLDKAELILVFALPPQVNGETRAPVEIQFALRLPYRSKPLYIPHIKEFFTSLKYNEQIFMGGKRYCFSLESFEENQRSVIKMFMDYLRFQDHPHTERALRVAQIDIESFGLILRTASEIALNHSSYNHQEEELPFIPGFYENSLEAPLKCSSHPASIKFHMQYIKPPVSKLLLKPMLVLDQDSIEIGEGRFFECVYPGMLYKGVYYKFSQKITRLHLKNLKTMKDMTIPEPLLGSFVEDALPELSQFAHLENKDVIEEFVTIPYVGDVKGKCDLTYLDGELDALLSFTYNNLEIPASTSKLDYKKMMSFVSEQGVLSRNLGEERKIIEDLFQDFVYNAEQGSYISKSEKKIVEFMTDIIPRNQHRIQFNCPQNLLDQFIYDQTTFVLNLKHTDRIDIYEIDLRVDGALKGVKVDHLWECVASKKAFIELDAIRQKMRRGTETKLGKILVLDLDRIASLIQVFDELGVEILDNHKIERPLWSLANMDASHCEGLPIQFSMTPKLEEIRRQMIGELPVDFSPIPQNIKANLRSYQQEGVNWLERLRMMFLNGILADDMGLGKTLQSIVAMTQHQSVAQHPSLIVCPTSLLYNWKEELNKFNGELKGMVIDGVPSARKKMIESGENYDVIITSYTLLQKDVDLYKNKQFSYLVLDEAQHIKNRSTRNAKSVKQIPSEHKLILSGTPIENSLDELWSLFDFLMPGFLGSYDRFLEKYIRPSGVQLTKNLDYLRKKIAPFILRRMKADVLDDLPPISEIVYHCQLSDVQMALYKSYAESARDELVKLVNKEGFDRVQIHVLATLTRLKQICCHPAIFAKDEVIAGDSAKYDMLMELLQNLIDSKHKTVIFSQYTKMLQIISSELEQKGVRFLYLDGSSKNRLDLVKEFNEDNQIAVFLVSLKAGGTGLNLVGADTVIHYDMWWNPAVENQATDRVHRMGQKKSVSAYKLITLGTIEEKIAEMQKKKKGLVKKVVSCDDEIISKLTWEEVLELLKT